jgi:excisionase family DNA binding protein
VPKPDLRTEDVAEQLNTSYWTAWRLIKSGKLTAYRLGTQFRVRPADLAAYIRENRVVPGAAR